MRELLYGAVSDAREEMAGLVAELRGENRLSDDEVLAQYETMRGDPLAVIGFAARKAPPGADVLAEAVAYEREMETLWRNRAGSAEE